MFGEQCDVHDFQLSVVLCGSMGRRNFFSIYIFNCWLSSILRTLKQEVGPKNEVHCSRERSRAAWKAIEEVRCLSNYIYHILYPYSIFLCPMAQYLMPFVDEEQYQLPTKCRLNPENDMFRDQEQHKIHVETNEWSCRYCRKSFRAEKFLDQHFDNRHYNLLNDVHFMLPSDINSVFNYMLANEREA